MLIVRMRYVNRQMSTCREKDDVFDDDLDYFLMREILLEFKMIGRAVRANKKLLRKSDAEFLFLTFVQ